MKKMLLRLIVRVSTEAKKMAVRILSADLSHTVKGYLQLRGAEALANDMCM